jgi:uncharacterized damage-inducible protein DinB
MTANEVILLNFKEIRRRSIKLWTGIPPDNFLWKPDINAMNGLEMVRHVLEAEHLFHVIINNRDNLGGYISPWTDRQYSDLQAELDFAEPFRNKFLDSLKSFTPAEFSTIAIICSEKGQCRLLGDYLQRIAYHEAVHTGQMLLYLRILRLERPLIWD